MVSMMETVWTCPLVPFISFSLSAHWAIISITGDSLVAPPESSHHSRLLILSISPLTSGLSGSEIEIDEIQEILISNIQSLSLGLEAH